MKPPGPISDIELMIKTFSRNGYNFRVENLTYKWIEFVAYTIKKYKLKSDNDWIIWCKWYIKRMKCEEILK